MSKLKRLMAYKHMLYVLKNSDDKLRKALLKNGDNELIQTISEIVLNVLQGNVELCDRNKKCLGKYKSYLRLLASNRGRSRDRNVSLKRKILVQHGGFLPTLLTALLSSAIGTVLNNMTQRKTE